MKLIFLFLIMATGAVTSGKAQGCKVLLKPLAGSYDGDCRSNKADGHGKAVGIDTYEGEFKSGYPEGKGIYTWKSKDWYDGNWKNGMREGEGSMHIMQEGKRDSIVSGFWKKDRYVGKFEKPYKILGQTQTISTVDVTPGESKFNEIVVILSNVTGGLNTISSRQRTGGPIPKIKLTAVDVTKGSYDGFFSEIPYQPNATKYIMRKVVYPFTAYFRTDTDFVEIAFYEEGSYSIDIKVLN
ncbi:MAG: hypothetical protein V4539_10510 [Bacteroidota bacterium]